MAVDESRIGGLWLVYGIPGTGKTILGALADGIVPAVRAGRTIFTNVDGLSTAGISSLADVPALQPDIRYLDGINDVVTAFDLPDCHNALFVIDEMKQFMATDERAIDWVCQRLNIMRKRSNDFIMIAQLEDYFPREIRKLAKGCTLYKRCFGWGSKSRTREYRFDGGSIVIKNGDLKPNAFKVRRIPRELFTCYQSGIDGLIGIEDQGRHNSIWSSPKAILAYAFILFALVFLAFGVVMVFNVKGSIDDMSGAITGRSAAVAPEQINIKKAVKDETETEQICYTYKICDSLVCETDAGEFPYSSWSRDAGGFLAPAGVVRRCPGDIIHR